LTRLDVKLEGQAVSREISLGKGSGTTTSTTGTTTSTTRPAILLRILERDRSGKLVSAPDARIHIYQGSRPVVRNGAITAAGTFRYNLDAGNYRVEVTHTRPGYDTARTTVTIQARDTTVEREIVIQKSRIK
jgi:hypothetical protein